jgi:hypothetical protein
MKKYVLTALAAGLCCVATTFGQVPSYVPTSGLVGWWPFNGNANDESGNGNNGTVNGATLTTDRYGNANKAFYFSSAGCGTRIDADVNTNTIQNAYTFSYWFIQTGQGCVGPRTFEFSTGENASGFLQCQNWNTAQNVAIIAGTAPYSVLTCPTPLANEWSNITLTVNLNGAKLYYNGLISDSVSFSTDFLSLNGDMCMGRMNHPSYDAHEGKLDDIGIWNRALTQQEITALYQGCNVTASIAPQSNTTFCQGGSVTLQANTGTGYTYEWYKNGVFISGASLSSYIATTSGNYTVKVIDGSCNATSSAVTVTENTNPTVSLASIGAFTNYYATPVTLSGSPSGGTYSGSGVSGNTFNPQQAGLGATSINYSYTNASNCSGSASTSTIVYDTLGTVCTSTVTVYDTIYTTVTDTLIINTTLSLAPPNDQNTILIYPNPASDHITIDNGNYAAMAGYSIVIENNAGQQVFQSAINQAQFYVDLSSWTGNGLYFVHLFDPSGATVTVRKIVLQ